MIPFNNLPDNTKVDWFLQPTSGTETHTWTKPSGCNFVYMIAVGGGGAGGKGAAGGAGTTRSGGGGGGSGAISTLLVPAFLIPDTLFIRVGAGGLLGNGVATIISAYRISAAQEYLLVANSGGVGGNGTLASAGAGGAAGTVATATTNPLASIGVFKAFAGSAGSPGSRLDVPGPNLTAIGYLCGGGGGAGTTTISQAGGAILGQYFQPSSVTIVPGGVATGAGNGGFQFGSKRFAFFGGSGGGSNTSGAGQGGNGGKGALGCGGGGGGGGGVTGNPGNGGDGFVVIISY